MVTINSTMGNSLICVSGDADPAIMRSLGGKNVKREWRFDATPANTAKVIKALKGQKIQATSFVIQLLEDSRAMVTAQDVKYLPDESLEGPAITVYKPWSHQSRAFDFAKRLRACMLDMGMGTGKTKVAVDLIQNFQARNSLIVCPKRVADDVWERQIPRHVSPLFTYSLAILNEGKMSKRIEIGERSLEEDTQLHFVVTNYDVVYQEPFTSWLASVHWNYMVLDECHRIKRAGGSMSNALYRLGKRADRRLGMTGTMITRNAVDVYAQYRFLDSGIFGTNVASFRSKYFMMGGFGNKQVLGMVNEDELKKKIQSISIRIEEDVMDLPPMMEIARHTVLEPEAKLLYKELKEELVAEVEDGRITVSNALVKAGRLNEMANGFVKLDTGGYKRISWAKQSLFEDVIEDLPEHEPLVVFAMYTNDINCIKEACAKAGRTFSELSGKVDELHEWKNGETDVLIAQVQAGSLGIDLTRAKYGIYYSTTRAYGDFMQSRKRLWREGQKGNTTFIYLMVKGTVEPGIYRSYGSKEEDILRLLFDDSTDYDPGQGTN